MAQIIDRLVAHHKQRRIEHRERAEAQRIVEWARSRELAPFEITERKLKYKPYIPLQLGNVTIDLQPKPTETMHVAIGGSTRQGKTTAALSLLGLPVGALVVSLDNTRPIAEYIRRLPEGIEWSNEPGWELAWDMLRGDPRLVAEGLTAAMPRSEHESGHYRDIARLRIASRLAQADRDGEVRSLVMLIGTLMQRTDSPDPMVDRACRHWSTKLANLYDILGASIGGPGDLDLLEAMQSGKKVLMRLNRYYHPEIAPLLGGMLLVHARRLAQQVDVPFVLIVEEAGQMDEHDEQLKPLAQAAADRGVPTVILTQNLSKLPIEVSNNIAIWVSFSQEAKAELAFAAHHLRLDPIQLRREAFPGKDEQQGRGWCYVRGPGMLPHLVRIKPPLFEERIPEPIVELPRVRNYWTEEPLPAIDGWQPQITRALPSPRPAAKEAIPEWVGFDPNLLRFWKQAKRLNRPVPLWSPERGVFWDEQGCLVWLGPLSKHRDEQTLGRPRSNIGRRSVTVYIETKRATGAEVEPTLDHMCDLPQCIEPDHTYACTIAINNTNRQIREPMLERAWLDRYGQIPEWWERRHTQRVVA